ncbi:hypothetical protein J6590_069766 [Homalodisca vitripennis]|nr:hypothetical protein J6590_069766 [Homalodisca vitripennis]
MFTVQFFPKHYLLLVYRRSYDTPLSAAIRDITKSRQDISPRVAAIRFPQFSLACLVNYRRKQEKYRRSGRSEDNNQVKCILALPLSRAQATRYGTPRTKLNVITIYSSILVHQTWQDVHNFHIDLSGSA